MKLGYKASAEQFGPVELLEFARHAERIGLESVGIEYLHLRRLGTPADGRAAPIPKRCPKCERQMVKRTSKKDGGKFWGCSGYPRCRGIVK